MQPRQPKISTVLPQKEVLTENQYNDGSRNSLEKMHLSKKNMTVEERKIDTDVFGGLQFFYSINHKVFVVVVYDTLFIAMHVLPFPAAHIKFQSHATGFRWFAKSFRLHRKMECTTMWPNYQTIPQTKGGQADAGEY
ncbi:hypothetical protein B9Z55_025499 [Caenorhabditis nigoni]|uniref:Uncharacterized protein n=1 Tax=Caenorhabditis nigoni TaxID=1611254 RepID=A0A2G5SZF5_9PELO|nr:hypothetical protein B9Z55_025499 [Caenorhabditis nigoni]